MTDVTLSIVIVTGTSRDRIDRCLTSVYGAVARGVEVVVWDDASQDGTIEHVRRAYPGVRAIASAESVGFARGGDAAIATCAADVVVLLKPDAIIDDIEDLFLMADLLQRRRDIAAVGPRLVNDDGSHWAGDAGWRASITGAVGHSFFLHRLIAAIPALYLTNRSLLERDEVAVDWIGGTCLVIRRDVWARVGGLDGDIFPDGDVVAWGERCRDHGFTLLYLPWITVEHLQGGARWSEAEAFFPIKAMDALVHRMARRSSPLRFCLFRRVLQVGFLIRAGVFWIIGTAGRRPASLAKASAMLRYAAHADHLARNVHS
jgi:GT2 family glycosyltransferase